MKGVLSDLFVRLLIFLGPLFIKIGQVLANRGDYFSSECIEKLKTIQTKVPDSPLCEIPDSIELMELIGSGSVAQVFKCKYGGETYVIKIKRLNIERRVERNIAQLSAILSICSLVIPCDLIGVLDDIKTQFIVQNDFIQEMNNMVVFGEKFKKNRHIKIPDVVKEMCSKDYILMEYCVGELATLENVKKVHYDILVQFLMITPMVHNMIHGDLHLGNILISGDTLVILDYGIVFYLTSAEVNQFFSLVTAISNENVERCVSLIVSDFAQDTCYIDKHFDEFKDHAARDVRCINNSGRIHVMDMLVKMTNLLRKYRTTMKPAMAKLQLAFSTCEGSLYTLNSDCDFWSSIRDMCSTIRLN